MLQHLLFLRPSIEGISVTTENLIFKLIYGVTCPLFLSFGVIFYTRICFTDPINCISNSTDSFKVLRAIDSYCLENSYVVQESHQQGLSLQDSESINIDETENVNRIYQSNYQYAGIFFVLCGALAYIPYVLWEWNENGLLKGLLQKNLMTVIIPDAKDESIQQLQQIRALSSFWKKNKDVLKTYANSNIICEFLNFIAVLLLFILTNNFLDGNFTTFGITSSMGNRNVFPKFTNCSWDTVGPSGNPLVYHGVCTMNLNFLSEKMFYFSWWWIVVTMTLCHANLLYRYAIYRNANFRSWIILNPNILESNNSEILHTCSPTCEEPNCWKKFEPYLREISYGEFFMLKRLQANVTPYTFREILDYFNTFNRAPNKTKKEE